MEAKDTVMDRDRMLGCSLRGQYCFDDVKDVILDACMAQAEITWDKAIREVVEWVKHPAHKHSYQSGTYHFYQFSVESLQAKLKDWGVK